MSYQVPQHIADSKIFWANFSEVQGGRLDPVYVYSTKHKRIYNYASKSLNKLVSFATGGTPSKANPEYWNGNIFWVSAKDFKSFYIDSSEDTITELGLNKSSSKLIPQNSLLMVVRSGILLHTLPIAITKCPVAINQDIKALFVKDIKMNAQYLGYFFDVFNKYVLSKIVKHSTTVQSVNTNELEKLEIPLPSLEIQKEIVSLMDDAYAQKLQKEQQAKALLQSIDGYLLNELGIQLPETKSQTIQDRMFVVNFSEVSGDRLDVEFNNPHKHGAISKVLKNAKYPTALLSFLAKDIFQGVGKDETEDSTYVLLKVKNILRGNMIDYSDVEFVKSVPQNKLLLRNDIISPFIGEAVRQIKFSLFDKEEYRYTVDNNTGVIRLKESVNAQYVCEYLCSCLGKMQIERLIGGGGVPFLGSSGAKKLNIIIPPLQKQQEIVDHISSIRQQAKALQEEGKAILEQAKKEVEQMIIG